MITLLSPAKTLDFDSNIGTDLRSEYQFQKESVRVMKKLKSLSRKKIANLMTLSENLSNANYERFQTWSEEPSDTNVRQAVFMFKGEVYLGLDPYSLTEMDLTYAQNNIRILSGLYGYLKPLDAVQAYRLEMGTKLPVGKNKNLYEFWGSKISETINKELEESGGLAVVNLASNEYAKAADLKSIHKPVITPVFKDFKNGDYKVISFFAKKARGVMARWIVQTQTNKPEDLVLFNEDGYAYNDLLSTANKPVFTRG